jgi:hypothetical protein
MGKMVEPDSSRIGPASDPYPLWKHMKNAAIAEPPSPLGPQRRYAAMLRIVAGFLNTQGHQQAAFLLLDQADQAWPLQ